MLSELTIKNFAIIDDLHIRFSSGLTLLSGETGAGKSIIISAVNLVLGGRVAAELVRTGCDTAEIQACFEIAPGSDVYARMEEKDLDPADGLLIRRVISRRNRHRIYINERASTLAQLVELTENLAAISGQHAHQGLLREDVQLGLLDRFGGLGGLGERVERGYRQITPLIGRLQDLLAVQDRQTDQLALFEFQKNEIVAADIRPGEDAELHAEKSRLKNGEFLYQTAHACIDALYDRRESATELLSAAAKDLERAAEIDTGLSDAGRQAAEAAYRVEDLTASLRSYLDNVQIDPDRLEQVEARLDALAKLKRKYGGSLEAVLDHLAQIEKEMASLANVSRDIDAVKASLKDLSEALIKNARILSEKRRQAAAGLSKRVEKELDELKMAGTRFSISLDTRPAAAAASPYLRCDGRAVFPTGLDTARFMISPNVGEALKPLAGIASGGELSRIVLALKSILADTASLETVIFDEVDAGIGGGTADVVGRKLLQLSRYHQVICITHLPQIARFADHHFKISKHVDKGRTRTGITPIPKAQRAEEIARMLGGERITQKTLDHAAEMLDLDP